MDRTWYDACEAFSEWVDENCPDSDASEEEWTSFFNKAKAMMPAGYETLALLAGSKEIDDDELDDDYEDL